MGGDKRTMNFKGALREGRRKEKKNTKTQEFLSVCGGWGKWINHRSKEVGREKTKKKKKKREERMGTLEVKGRAWPRVEKSRGSEKA